MEEDEEETPAVVNQQQPQKPREISIDDIDDPQFFQMVAQLTNTPVLSERDQETLRSLARDTGKKSIEERGVRASKPDDHNAILAIMKQVLPHVHISYGDGQFTWSKTGSMQLPKKEGEDEVVLPDGRKAKVMVMNNSEVRVTAIQHAGEKFFRTCVDTKYNLVDGKLVEIKKD